MSQQAEQFKIVRATQGTSALANNIYFHLGWRPVMVKAYDLTGGHVGIWVDELTTDGTIGKGSISPTDSSAYDHDSALGIVPKDRGFVMEQDTDLLRKNSGKLVFECYRNLTEPGVVAISSSLPEYDGDAYGKGTQWTPNTAGNTYDPALSDFGLYKVT